MMLKLDVFKSLPLISGKLFERKPLSDGKITLKSELGNTVQTQLVSKFSEEVLDALKIIMIVFIEGEDISTLLPKIINLLPNENDEVKRMSQYLVSELSKVVEDKSPLILSISSLHKEVLNAKALHRGNAVKTLSSIMLNAPDVLHVLTPTLNKMVLDKNAYVRKTCAIAWLKMVNSDAPEDEIDKEQILNLLQKHLFKDIPYVMGPALVAYEAISQDLKYEFLHATYRRICKDILKFSPFDRSLILEMLHKYAFLYLSGLKKEKKNKLFSDEDLNALYIALEKVAMTQDLPSIIQAAKIVLFLEDEPLINKYTLALLKLLNKTSETKYHVLLTLEQYAKQYPKLVSSHYKKFYVHHLEKNYCKLTKLRILHEVIEDWNFGDIFEEYCEYANYHSKELTAMALVHIGKIALKCPKYAMKCVKYLMNNVMGRNSFLASKSIIALSEYLHEMNAEKIPILAYCVNNLNKIESEDAKLKLINLLILNVEPLKTIALKVFHGLVMLFRTSSFMIKLRTVELGFTLLPFHKESKVFSNMLDLTLEMGSFDENILLRDFSKFLRKILDKDSQKLEINLKNYYNTSKTSPTEERDRLLGTLSYLTGYRTKGCKGFPKEEEIVNDSTVNLRHGRVEVEEIAPKKTQSPEKLFTPSKSPVKEQSAPHVEVTKKQEEKVEEVEAYSYLPSVVETKDLSKLNDDFFEDA